MFTAVYNLILLKKQICYCRKTETQNMFLEDAILFDIIKR
jgi:hypothetical protein